MYASTVFQKMESFMQEWVEFSHIAIFNLNLSLYAKRYESSNNTFLSQET
jgi:hypothetical protein